MSEIEQADKPVKPWQWPGQWARDHTFYRDIATRTASGLIILLIGYVSAVLLGYVATPDGKNIIAWGSLILWPAVSGALVLKYGRRIYRRLNRPGRRNQAMLGITLFLLPVIIVTVEGLLYYLFSNNEFFFNPRFLK
ncbi:peptidoglycan/LPS O-acetylase OafA/YrhL [Pseudarthrobacter oxydans]|uniref:Peptidoglycan/LPS O-acetylase OafA/YrhL n=1 Tax=Pseudarthrobacter oxydans TaxID=1671 RepID=A0AAW8NH75_PSEOX|nr:hypothetical protein [Pseudarthrobacter oxydans]MDR6794713.1 peptidoglycan/LPS O-acetylase OafA/YrhL [Pseudarthrobacter oxydans]MDR7166085.1 peptidoglycan/LPS O-acetylase OafA/YrhL [Pseudarthrobacter oxydans]